MHIAILTFQGFNELDSLIALGILNRVRRDGWRVLLDGRAIARTPTRDVARVLGLLPQTPVAPDGLTVADLVARCTPVELRPR